MKSVAPDYPIARTADLQAAVIERAPNGLVMVDPQGGIVLVNAQIEKSFGYKRAELLGRPIELLVPERFRSQHSSYRQGFIRQPTTRAMGAGRDLYGLRKDGSEFPVEIGLSPLETEQGTMVLGTIVDITERKRAEEKSMRLATAVEQSGDSIVITDTDGNISYVNPAFEQTTGYASGEVLGRNPRFLKGGKVSREYYQNLWQTISSGDQWTGHFTNRRKDGSLFEEEATISPVRDRAGNIVSYVAVKRDVTERMRAEEEIRKLNEELEQRVADRTAQLLAANKELEAFSYSVSHDLRAPLRHINGFSQAVLEDYGDQLDAGGKHYLQEVRNASQEMSQLIDDVLQLARVTRSEMRQEEVNLSDLAHSVIADLGKGDCERNVAIDIESGLYARGDKRLLRIVLINLLGNAWKFTSKQAKAEISFGRQKRNGESLYFVRDNGAGFDMAYANKLFGAFQRLHTSDQFEGTGIGLATVQRIVHRHGGRVHAEGKLNEGASFYFTLPNSKENGDG